MRLSTATMIADVVQRNPDALNDLLDESVDLLGLKSGQVGQTASGHIVPTHNHQSYESVHARKNGKLHGYDHFSPAEHEYAAKRHEAVAILADEHRQMFERLYSKTGVRLHPGQRERFSAVLAGMAETTAGGKRCALAHRRAGLEG